MKRKPYREGDWFGIPLDEGWFGMPLDGGSYALGRIARVGRRGGMLLGYFFEPPLVGPPTIDDTRNLTARDAFYITRFGDLGIIEGQWPVVSDDGIWARDDWPVPTFGRIVDIGQGWACAITYDESELEKTTGEVRISREQALQLPEDGYAGHNWLKLRLVRYFREGQKPYDPSETKKSYTWIRGLPRE